MLVLHLDLGLRVAELLEELPLLLLGQVLTQQELGLLPEELHLRHLVDLLHLVQLLQVGERRLHLLLVHRVQQVLVEERQRDLACGPLG